MEVTFKKRYFVDEINDAIVYFYSDAEQKLIDALQFEGEWHIVRSTLQSWGYKVVEIADN